MRYILFLLAFGLAQPASAQSVFAALTGDFGADFTDEACNDNPKSQSFSPDHTRIHLSWPQPVPSYMRDEMILFIEGDIVASDAESITYLRDEETRQGPDGKPILWTFRVTATGYCVTRSDMRGSDCLTAYRRCDTPVS